MWYQTLEQAASSITKTTLDTVSSVSNAAFEASRDAVMGIYINMHTAIIKRCLMSNHLFR